MKQIIVLLSACVLASSAMAIGDRSKVDTTGLVAYYPFSGNAGDSSGHGHNGTVHGATLTADRFGNANSAYSFNGSSDYIEVPNSAELNPTSRLTLSAWVRADSWGSYDYANYVLSTEQNGPNQGYSLRGGGTRVTVLISGGGSWQVAQTAAGTIGTASWHHLAGVYDGSKLLVYIDGQQKASVAYAGSITASTGPLVIGTSPGSYLRWFDGAIDEVRIYNRALSQAEIDSLYGIPVSLTAPILISPADSAILTTPHYPTFVWHKVDTAEYYTFMLSADKTFQYPVENFTLTDTTCTLVNPVYSSLLYWRVTAHKSPYSRVSVTWTFRFGVPALISPPADTIFTNSNTPTFLWHSVDSASYYTLSVSTNSSMSAPYVVVHSLSDTMYTTLSPLGDGHYYWQVKPYVPSSLDSFESEARHFSVNVYGGVAGHPEEAADSKFLMEVPHPNPAHERTMIKYQLPVRSVTRVELYNVAGQKIATLYEGQQEDGYHTASWNLRDATGRTVSNGVYFIRLCAGSRQITGKLTVIR